MQVLVSIVLTIVVVDYSWQFVERPEGRRRRHVCRRNKWLGEQLIE